MDSGILKVTVNYAKDLKKTQTLGKQDPYFICTCGEQVHTSKVINDGDLEPVWNETFIFEITTEISMKIEVFNKNMIRGDKLIGSSTINLKPVLSGTCDKLDAKLLGKKSGKEHGEINIKFEFKSSTVSSPKVDNSNQKQASHGSSSFEKEQKGIDSEVGEKLTGPMPTEWPPKKDTSIWD